MLGMRTTLTLDPDVAERLRQETVLGNRTMKQVVNNGLRRGLGIDKPKSVKRFAVRPHSSSYCPGVDRGKLTQFIDELDAVTFLERKGNSSR
jgi:hypothetical protein